jgi:hypothetical protein
MSVASLLAEVRSLGLSIRAEGDDLVIRPTSRLPPELRSRLLEAKPALLGLLRNQTAKLPSYKDLDGPCARAAIGSSYSGSEEAGRRKVHAADILAGLAASADSDHVDPASLDNVDPADVAANTAHLLDRQTAANRGRLDAGRAPASGPRDPTFDFDALVQRLAAALMTPRPWQRVTDPVRARSYFEARARHLLSRAKDPLAEVEREEAAARPFAMGGKA